MCSQVWGQLQANNDNYDTEHGERLQASHGFITDMLRKLALDLIVEVRIERGARRWRYESQKDDDERIPETTRLYVFKSNGSVITL